MQNKEKVALFDFCETLVNFQTADAYVDYVRDKMQDKRMYKLENLQNNLRKIKLIQIFEKITGYRYSINKRVKLWQLKGLSFVELQKLAIEYYQEKIRPNFISELLDRLKELKESGYSVYLVSGGYDIYLRCFAEEFELSGVISTKIGFKEGNCTGKFEGLDCLKEGKVNLLNQYFIIKPNLSVAFSDSVTDLPFLKWVHKGYVVSKEKHQVWSDRFNLEEIIWTEKRKF